MASVTIITDIFRASHVHLKEAKKFNDNDEPKFRVSALWPQSGVGTIEKLGVQFPSSHENVVTAIKQVVMEEFGFDFDPYDDKQAKMMGIQFPPNFKNGNLVLRKENGLPVPGELCPISSGNWILNLTNADQPGVVEGRNISPIDPAAVYSGCWGRAQLEVSAFVTKGTTPSRIISIKFLNFMMCYDDESFGGQGPKQEAATAFSGMNVANSNLSAGVGQGNFRPEGANTAPAKPTAPVKPAPVAPAKPTAPVKPVVPVLVMNADSPYTLDDLKAAEWTDEQIVEAGYATMQVPKPVAPTAPVKPVPPTKPAPVAPVKPTVPTTGTVIMKPGCEYTYEQLTGEYGWSDADIITAGYATPNFTNPQ